MFVNPIKFSPNFGMAMIPKRQVLEALQDELKATPMKKIPAKMWKILNIP